MPIIGNPWAQDATRFAQGVGDSLTQGMMQLPQQRYMMALQQAQMQQRQQQAAAMEQNRQQQLAQGQQRLEGLNKYHNDELGLRKQSLEQQGDYNSQKTAIEQLRLQNEQLANQIRMMTAQRPTVQGGMVIQPNNQPSPNDAGIQTNQTPQSAWSVSPIAQKPEMPGQAMGNAIKAASLYGAANNSSLTNNPDVMNLISNLMMRANSQALGQTNQPGVMQQTNQPSMMQSNNIPSWASQQLPDGSFNFAP